MQRHPGSRQRTEEVSVLYPEERQHAIAEPGRPSGAGWPSPPSPSSSASPPRPSGAISPSWSGPGCCAGCTAAPCPAGALTLVEPGLGERHGTRTEAKRKIAAAALDLLPGHRRQRHPRRRQHDGRPGRRPAAGPPPLRGHELRADRRPPVRLPRRHAARPRRAGPGHHADRGRRRDRAVAAGPPRRRRLPRHQRDQRRPRLQHARRGRGGHQAGDGRARRSG